MVKLDKEPVSPVRPETNLDAKHQLTIAMGLAIAAISKEKGLAITLAEVKEASNNYQELTIQVVVKADKEQGEKYNEDLRIYWKAHENWEVANRMAKFGITREEHDQVNKEYLKHCQDVPYRERIEKEAFFESKLPFSRPSPIIEVA